MTHLKPMLAEDVVTFEALRYPLYGSFKIDGVRALMPHKELKPRSLKEFGNRHVRDFFNAHSHLLSGFDGELTLGANPAPDGVRLCNLTSSALATQTGTPDIHWWIFDIVMEQAPFSDRVKVIRDWFRSRGRRQLAQFKVHMVEQRLLKTAEEAIAMEAEALALGYEGLILKDPDGLYKYGRSTLKSQQFLRVKRFTDAEGIVVGFVERQKNNNVATTNALGHKTRSSHKANKTGAGTLGTLQVRMENGTFVDKELEVGTGWDAKTGQWIWDNQAKVLGRTVKVQYFEHGCKDLPRFPTFQGFREEFDVS